MVFVANEGQVSGVQIALRQYASSNPYSAKLPLIADKVSAIGTGDVIFPLGVKVGANGTVNKADNGGVITLPDLQSAVEDVTVGGTSVVSNKVAVIPAILGSSVETWTFTLADNTTVTKTVVLG